ncbi:tetratricopeptide repeat protein 27 [Sabethes cyaneus]|uniref:tetratricopeptide repeat protein 27 n=1 Tax=Sabethes cyaneus TaxID=53552 RepID=UPI00237E7566|nr:tetratricopeptide repeat protein 27 [Sabethes cyaneus]
MDLNIRVFNFLEEKDYPELAAFYHDALFCDWEESLSTYEFHKIEPIDWEVVFIDRQEILVTGIAALCAFTQDNFVGPSLPAEYSAKLMPGVKAADLLKSDGEELNENVSSPELLYICKKAFDVLTIESEELGSPASFEERLWYLRYLMIHQRCLDDLSHELYSKFDRNTELLVSTFSTIDHYGLLVQSHIEIAQGYIFFKRITKSEQWMKSLKDISGIELTVEGALGVRTQHQQNPLPQLTLRVNILNSRQLKPAAETHGEIILPSMLNLDDDLRLEKTQFIAEEENKDVQLPSLVQEIIFTNLLYLKHSQPRDKLADEELQPYLTTLLYQKHGPLATRIAALLFNIQLEANHKRTVERSFKQCEDLIRQLDGGSNPLQHRLAYAFASGLTPRWQIKATLGRLRVSLGMTKTALDLFLELHLWEEVIACYTTLDLRHKAAEIIQQEISKKPTVLLYCLLGDATDDVGCYGNAWELSKETSARAQRHWGNYYFAKNQFAEAIPHFQKSIQINCLQETTLLRLGFAALQLEQWDVAAEAYRFYTSLESHGFEAWNNLAKAYVKLGQKTRAHKILQEALKCNFDNWKVWENFLLVSIDTKNYEDAINAYERLMELKDKFEDHEILEILTKVVFEGALDASDNSSQRLTKKMLQLLGHACARNVSNGYLYELSAQLEGEDMLKKANKLQNAYRAYTQSNNQWSKAPDSSEKILKICIELCKNSLQAFFNAKHDLEMCQAVKSQLSSARLTGQGCLRAASNENWEQNADLVNQLKYVIEALNAELTDSANQ